MGVRKIRQCWWVDFRFRGNRYRKRSPENSRAGAQAYEIALRSKLSHGESINRSGSKQGPGRLFKDFAREWYESYVKTNNKFSEIRTKRYLLSAHLIPCFGKMALNEIGGYQVEQFKAAKMKEKKLSNKTINNQLTVLGKCLRTAQEWGLLASLPAIKKLKAEPCEPDYLTHDESEHLLKYASGMWREMILVALKTGLRFGELRALDWTDINWEQKVLTVRRSLYRTEFTSTKSNRIRHVPLLNEVYGVLAARREKSGLIFADEHGRYLIESRCRKALTGISKEAGIRRIGWHALRHTFASHLAQAGASMISIKELMGHADIQTTMRYSHLTPNTLRSTVDLLETKPILENFGQLAVNRWEKTGKVWTGADPRISLNLKQKQDPGVLSDLGCGGGI